jgi:hypothetical protein
MSRFGWGVARPRPASLGGGPSTGAALARAPAAASPAGSAAQSAEIRELKLKLQRAKEEIAELKMLVAIYEEQLAPKRPGQPQRVNGY